MADDANASDRQQRAEAWAVDQRALARALKLSLEEWLVQLDLAAKRKTGLTAAVVGAAVARGLGLGVLDQLDGPDLAERARALIDPAPPDVDSPVLKEAIRRADELVTEGRGAARLRSKRRRRSSLPTPQRNPGADMSSSEEATADAPGEETESE